MTPLLVNSQSIYKGEIKRGEILGTKDSIGNIYIHMHIEDAKIFLTDLLDYELIVDSILPAYEEKDSLQTSAITLNMQKITELQKQSLKLKGILNNLEEIGTFKDLTIENVEKQVKKEKLKKTLGFIGSGLGGIGIGIVVGVTVFYLR